MVWISSRCQAPVADRAQHDDAQRGMRDGHAERGARRGAQAAQRFGDGARPRRRRPANSTRLPTISQTPKPKATPARVARPSMATAATMAATTETTKATRRLQQRGPQLGALPAEERADAERGEQRRADRHEGGVEEGRADRDLVAGEQVEEQRIERAQQHRGGERAEQQVVQDQRALAADRLEQPARRAASAPARRRAPGRRR